MEFPPADSVVMPLAHNTTTSVFVKYYCTPQCTYCKADTTEQGCGETTVTPFCRSFCLVVLTAQPWRVFVCAK